MTNIVLGSNVDRSTFCERHTAWQRYYGDASDVVEVYRGRDATRG